jgi:2-polyprenyl-6-methoxyphenol hydroxylase-like FAD-dependent oxidoreductase
VKAVVVGAGIGGLAAAIALRRAGWDVRVIEQADTPRELGFALALAPNALEALGELGLREEVVSRGVEVKAFELRRPDGRVLKRVDLHGDRIQAVVLLRPALHGTLLEAVGPAALTLGTRVSAPPDADVVVGADGVASAIRRFLHPDEVPPRPSGYHAVRGVSSGAAGELGGADSAVYLGDGVEIGFARASATAVYWYVSIVDELAGDGAEAILERCGRGLDERARAIIRATPAGDIRVDRLFYRDPIADWGRGHVTLLGDAAHPVLPHTAQGAALALEDAVALGLALRGEEIEGGLRRYERVRAARTRAVVTSGPRIAAMAATRSRVRIALREALLAIMPASALSRALAWHARDPHRELRG